jgi:hypothetical protein
MQAPNFLSQSPQQLLQQGGVVMVLRCVPDIFTSERLNIGVAAIDQQGKRACKVITEPGRLECLYGEAAGNVLLLAKAAEEAFLSGVPMPTSQVTLDEPAPFYNTSLQDVVHQVFCDQVTVALPRRPEASKKVLDDDEAWQQVSDHIKLLQHLQADVIANTPHVLIETDRGTRSVTAQLQPRHGVGTVRSADYSAATLKTHLMDSLLDLECAARYRHKRGMGIFILRPKSETMKHASAIDAVIDSITFRAPSNLFMEVSHESQELAGSVAEWAASMND